MHVFIDESGGFIPLNGAKTKWSCVAALAVPSAVLETLGSEFHQYLDNLACETGEIKGSQLNEAEVAGALQVLTRHDLVLELCAIDMGHHTVSDMERIKELQAQKLFEHITPEHQPGLITDLERLAADIRALSNQLYAQSFLIIHLVDRLLETMTMYYAQRRPEELGAFHWIVDAKGLSLTRSERVWTNLILPALQERSRKKPMAMLEGADYSHFDRFTVPLPPEEVVHDKLGTDIKLVIKEDLRFANSISEIGLQMVDIVANAATRALNGTLGTNGWADLGTLLVRRREQTIHLVSLKDGSDSMESAMITDHQAYGAIKAWEKRAKTMLTSTTLKAQPPVI